MQKLLFKLQAQEFLETVQSHQQKLAKMQTSVGQTSDKSKTGDKKEPLSAVFKPAVGSWECKMCYVRNDAEKAKCVACNNPAPGKSVEATPIAPVSQVQKTSSQPKSLFDQFKPAAGSWTCEGCYMVNKGSDMKCPACDGPNPSAPSKPRTPTNIASSQAKPLSEIFKSAAGSWTCQGCYMVNKSSDLHCPACEAPKDPSIPPKPKTSIFGTSTDSSTTSPFTFGIPQTKNEASSTFPFSISNTNSKTPGKNYQNISFFLENLNTGNLISVI